MMNTLTLLLVALSLSCCTGQSMESIPSSSVVKRPGETLSLSCRGSGFTFSCCGMNWIRQPAGKGLEWIGIGFSAASSNAYASSVRGRAEISRDDSNSMVYLRLSNLKPEDSAVYYCARESAYSGGYIDYWGKGTMVTVTSATATAPSVFPLWQCGSGTGDITLGCLATGFTPSSITFSWKKENTALTDFIQYPPVPKGNFYTGVSQIRVRRQDWDDRRTFYCSVTHPAGNNSTSMMKPTVPHQLPTLRVLASSNDESEASFSCFAKDFSPKTHDIKWLKNGEEITNKVFEIKTPLQETGVLNGAKLYSAASFLTVKSNDVSAGTPFTCEFKGKNGNNDVFTNSTVYPGCGGPSCPKADVEIKIEGPTLKDMFVNKRGTLTCQVTVNKPSVERIFWEDQDGKEMADSSMTPTNGKMWSLKLDITYEEWTEGIKRYCVVEHSEYLVPFKELYERKAGGQTQRPSVFMLSPVEQSRKDTVTLTCYVKDFHPQEVYVSWLVDDEAADSTYEFSTTNPVGNDGSFSVYGELTLNLNEWKDNDKVFSCVVYHQSVVNNTKAIVRSIGHRTFEKTNLVNLNMNIPETCKAH